MRRHLPAACRVLALLMLLLRLAGPAGASFDVPDVDPGAATLAALFPGGLPICHTPRPSDPSAPAPAPTHDCQLCLLCHLHSPVPLLPVVAAALPQPGGTWLLVRGRVPPPAGPPTRPLRRATPPIGPPSVTI